MTVDTLDEIVHSTHLSKNWTKEDQKRYHHEWYEKHKKKKQNKDEKEPLFKVFDTPEDREERGEAIEESEDDLDNYLENNPNALNNFISAARNETVADTLSKLKKKFGKKKNRVEVALEHADDIPYNAEEVALAHHGILGMRWGHLNGPPYPIGSGDHSAAEKGAASKAGIKVGSNSGKGSIENVGKRASSTKSSNPIKRYKVNKQRKENLAKARQVKVDKAEQERRRQAALASGDYRQIQSVMRQSSNDEINAAMARADLYAKVNSKVPKQKDAIDKIDDAMRVVNKIDDWYAVGTKTWNNFATTYNAFNKDGNDLLVIGQDPTKLRSAEDKKAARVEKQRKKADEAMNRYAENAIRRIDLNAYREHPEYFTSKQVQDLGQRMANDRKVRSGKGIDNNDKNNNNSN